MAERITTYTQETAREILRRLDRLEQRQNSLLNGGHNQAFPMGPLVTRWGVTSTTSDYQTYPTSGNVVGVKLGDYEPSPLYPGSTAVKTFTAYDPAVYVYATLESGSMPSEGTYVRLTWRNGKWWILPDVDGGPPSCVLITGEAYNSDMQGDLVYRSVGNAANRWCYLFWDEAWGDLAGTSVAAVNTASGVSTFDDPSFETTQAGLYRFQLRLILTCDTANPSYDVDNVTTSTVSGHAHTVDIPLHYGFAQAYGAILEHKDGAGAWTSGADDTFYMGGVNGSSLSGGSPPTVPMMNAVWWQMHNYPGRRYRIQVWMNGDHPTDDNTGVCYSPILQVTRLGDYAADQTL